MSFETAKRMEALPFSGIRVMMERANRMQKEGADIIHMEIGRPDFDTPEVIKQAAYDSLAKGHVFYTSNYGIPALREAIAEKLTKENGVAYAPEEILVTIGVGEGTYAAVAAFCNPGEEILVPNPVWLNYIHVPNFFGAVPVAYDLKEERDYQIDVEELESKITDKTRMLVINTPGNPTGAVQTRETLEQLADLAKRHDLIVVSDEIYEKLVYGDTKHVSIASLPGMKERTITLNGFSKCYSMTGWRLGYAAGPRPVIAAMAAYQSHATGNANSIAQYAGLAALKGSQQCVYDMAAAFSRRRMLMLNCLKLVPHVSTFIPKGAFYVLLDVRETFGMTLDEKVIHDGNDFAEMLLKNARVSVVPGDAFGAPGYVRLSYAVSDERILEAVRRIGNFTDKLQKAKTRKFA